MLTRILKKYRFSKSDYYILSEITTPFFGGIFFLTFVFLMFQALRLAEFFIVHGIAGSVILKMVGLLVLSFLPMAIPISFLLAVLVGFGRLSADSELVAMKACGISIHRMAIPASTLSLVAVIFSLFLNLEWVPWGERSFKSLLIKVSNTKVVSSINAGTFTSGFFDLLIFADAVDPQTNSLKRVFIYDEREPKNPLTVVAQEGEVLSVRSGSELAAAALLELKDGNIHGNDIENGTYQRIDFGTYQLFLQVSEGKDTKAIKPKMLSYRTLIEQAKSPDSDDRRKREMSAELWRRIGIAISPLVFVFIGIGFGTVRTRAVRAGAAFVCAIAAFSYYGLQLGATSLSQKGVLPPAIAMQFPNLISLIVGLYAFRKAAW